MFKKDKDIRKEHKYDPLDILIKKMDRNIFVLKILFLILITLFVIKMYLIV